jgi:AmiR/NasT family two-component response regulator
VWCTGDLPRTPVARTFVRSSEAPGILLSSDVQNIIELLGPREVVGRAVDLLMATHDVSRDIAFAMLVRDSSLSRRTVREVAAAMVGQRGD